MRSPITTHILDTAMGKPASKVSVVLSQKKNTGWEELARSMTNADGRVEDLLPAEHSLEKAIYRLEFFTLEYFQRNNLLYLLKRWKYKYFFLVSHQGFLHVNPSQKNLQEQ